MNWDAVGKIASAVLYEGYVLYPYRSSAVKNQQRFNFGVLYPREYCDLNPGSDSWHMQTECLVMGSAATSLEVRVRFLQMAERPGMQQCASWQEGIEHDICTPACGLDSLEDKPYRQNFTFPVQTDAQGRRRAQLEGELEIRSARMDDGLYKITLQVRNRANISEGAAVTRDEALLRSMVSAHNILHVAGGRFVSPVDPPERYRSLAQGCNNIGTWPVMAGEEGQAEFILSAPIILYDYPQIAPESPGDLCDGTEIDEILALRILTLTDEEKREVREGDERARRILERTELLPPEHFQKLHGALRSLRPPSTPDQHEEAS